jgi:mono/diheme cytochrome c family protein
MQEPTGHTRLLAALLGVASMAGFAHAGAEDGKALYDKQCKVCHSIAGEKGMMGDKGGPLDGTGAKHDAAWLTAYLQDPKSKIPEAKMPKMKLSEQQIADLVAFLLTLK